MRRKLLLWVWFGILTLSTFGEAAAQSYLPRGDLETLRQLQNAPSGNPGTAFTAQAQSPADTGSFSAQFNQAMTESERQKQQRRETSATNGMQMRSLTEPQRPPSATFPGAPDNSQGAVYIDKHGPTFCTRNPSSNQYQCTAAATR